MTVRKGRIKAELNSKRKRHDQSPLGAPSTGSIGGANEEWLKFAIYFWHSGNCGRVVFLELLGLGVFSPECAFWTSHVQNTRLAPPETKKKMMGDGGGRE